MGIFPKKPEKTLGESYSDRITGFKGVATGYCQYLSGCNQALLTPACAATGAYIEGQWFDIQRLENLPDSIKVTLDNSSTPGSDQAAPKY